METYGDCKLLPLTLDLMARYLWQETNFWLVIYECHSMLSRSVTSDSATPWTVACQASLFMEIPQARILELVAMPFSRGSSPPRNWTGVSCIVGRFFISWPAREAPWFTSRVCSLKGEVKRSDKFLYTFYGSHAGTPIECSFKKKLGLPAAKNVVTHHPTSQKLQDSPHFILFFFSWWVQHLPGQPQTNNQAW